MPEEKPGIVLVGGGRLAGLLVELFDRQGTFAGYVDDVFESAYVQRRFGLNKLGTSADLPLLRQMFTQAVVAITDVAARKKYGDLLDAHGFELRTLVSPTAIVARDARLGPGCIVRHAAVIGPNVVVGRNTVISDQAYIGHDSRIGSHVYIAPKAGINGSVTIGDCTFVGTGAVVLPERTIGPGGTIGAQACVTRSLPGHTRAAGVPATARAGEDPAVSIVMAAYNHRPYVGESISSALGQTFRNFELIIVDDGSDDGTAEEIRRFSDPRIRTRFLDRNQGIVPAKSLGYRMAQGKYIALLNSDDAFLPEKLERQADYLDTHPETGAVFTLVSVIDEQGRPFRDEGHFYYRVFDQPNRDRYGWLRHFFFHGNCLCAPSAMIRREVCERVGWPDPRFRQLSDMDWWIRICMRHQLHILEQPLTRFRVREGGRNASGPGPEVSARNAFETPRVLRRYLDIPDERTLLRIFPEAEAYTSPLFPLDRDLIRFAVARLALDHPNVLWRAFGTGALFELLGDAGRARKIHDAFGYAYRDLVEATGRCIDPKD